MMDIKEATDPYLEEVSMDIKEETDPYLEEVSIS